MNNSVVFSTFTTLCNHHFYLVPKHFHHSKRKLHIHWAGAPIHFFLQPLGNTNLHSNTMDLPILDISYKWNNTICDRVCVCVCVCACGFFQFTVALFTVGKMWQQPKCSSVDEWVNKFYLSIKEEWRTGAVARWQSRKTLSSLPTIGTPIL